MSVPASHGVWVRNLRVDYGPFTAVPHLDLTIPPGEIYGLIGPNGAGKTSTFRALATLLDPVHGEIFLGGRDARHDPEAARAVLAYMPDLAPLPEDLRAAEYLRFFAESHGLYGPARDQRVAACLEAVDLTGRQHVFCRALSLGMRQRLNLARCLLHQPKVLILDEPASGMDVAARASLKEALRAQAASGTTIILSSHILPEVQDICSSIGLLQNGRLVDSGETREVLLRQSHAKKRLRIRTAGSPENLLSWLYSPDALPAHAPVLRGDTVECQFAGDTEAQARFFTRLAGANLAVVSLEEIHSSIEEVVLRLASAPHEPAAP
jgi:ABC-2 type transport system ATP-binding protein